VRMGFIGSLPGKTPEATMASALYTDIKRWKAGIPGSVFCRCVTRPAAVAPRARPPPPEMSNAPHVESLGRVVVRTDRECDNIATMDLIFRRRGFEASKRVFYSRRLSDSLEKTHRRFQSSRSRSRRAGFFFRPTGDRSKNVLSISRKGL
jgi:hypothetical protein